ncbi:MAG: peptidylprolyl isomerase [Jatrophihabitantaceae bacterium]
MPTEKQRRETARRQLERQLQKRAEEQAARKRTTMIASIAGTLILIVVVVVVIVVALNGSDKKTPAADNPVVTSPGATSTANGTPTPSTSPTTSTSPSAAALPLGTCKFVAGGTAARKLTLPSDKASTSGTAIATVQTTQGTLTFSLDRAKAPCTVENFLSLAKQKYYNNTPCHRLVTSGIYVLQCGDPTGTGSGGPGYTFNDELSGSEKYTTGVLAMANSGANTNGSQFFIVYKDSTGLGPNYSVFGNVTKGLNVVDKVAAKGSDNANGAGDGKPKLAISIKSVTAAK